MTDLDELDVPTPRPEALCKRYANRMDPWWGYAFAAGLLAIFGGVIGVLALIWLGPVLGIVEKSTAAKVAGIVALVLGELLAYVVFVKWRRRRMSQKLALVRDGRIIEARVTNKRVDLQKYSNIVALQYGRVELTCGFNVWFGPNEGTTIKVLAKDDLTPVLAFSDRGRMYNGVVLRVAPV